MWILKDHWRSMFGTPANPFMLDGLTKKENDLALISTEFVFGNTFQRLLTKLFTTRIFCLENLPPSRFHLKMKINNFGCSKKMPLNRKVFIWSKMG